MLSASGHTANGLHYSVGGDGGGRSPLLLVHPMGADLSFWDSCRAVWEKRFRCVAVSLRGAGQSPRADAPLTIDRQAADLDALCTELGLERVIPVGCAVGAMAATAFAGAHTGRCAALVLSNPGFRTRPAARAMLQKRADTARAEGMASVSAQTVDGAFGPDAEAGAKRAFRQRLESMDAASYAFTIEGMLEADVSGFLPAITCPTLIVAGDRDTLLPPGDHAVPLHAGLPGSRYVAVPDGAHFIPFQQPDRFAREVADFLLPVLGPGAN